MRLFEYFWTGLLVMLVWGGLAFLIFGLPYLLSRWFGDSSGIFGWDGDGDGDGE
jgi:hypothetical protein